MGIATLFLIFALLLSYSSSHFPESTESEFSLVEEVSTPSEEQSLSGWTPLDLSKANANPQIQGLLYTGIQDATQQAVQDGSLLSGTYSVVKVISIEQNQEVKKVENYRFDVDVSNGQGVTHTIILEMTYNHVQKTSKVIYYSIKGQETEQELKMETEVEQESEQQIEQELEIETETEQESEQEVMIETEIEQESEQELETETEQLFPMEEETQSGFISLDLSQVLTDAQIQGLIQIGVKNATEQAIQNGSLPDGVYQVVQIISVEENLHVTNTEEYRFDVNISSGEGSAVSNIVFEMTYDSSSRSSQVISYSILSNQIIIPSTETYTPLDISTISTDPQIQGLITLGIQNVTQQAIQNYSLPSGTYKLGEIQSAGQGTLNPNDYQFNASIHNDQGTTANISFTLVYNNVSRSIEITSYSIANLFIPDTTETTETTTDYSGLPEGYTPVDMSSSEGILAYAVGSDGFYSVEQSAILSGQLPPSEFYLTSINSVGEKDEGGLVYYWFDINIADGYGSSARMVYTMSYNPVFGTESILFYDLYDVV